MPDPTASEPFLHLWRTADKDWMRARRAEWQDLEQQTEFSESPKTHLRQLKQYFLRGKLAPEYMGTFELFLLTPIDSSETARALFESPLFPDERAKSRVLAEYPLSAHRFAGSAPWFPTQVRWFVDGVLGHEYETVTWQFRGSTEVISPNPSYWCRTYVWHGLALLRGDLDYHPCVDTVDYFVSALAHATSEFHREFCNVDELLSQAAERASGSADDYTTRFAKSIASRKEEILRNWQLSGERAS